VTATHCLSPIDPEGSVLLLYPHQRAHWSIPGVMIEQRCSLVKAPCMESIGKVKLHHVEMMAELVTERAEQRAKRRDLLKHGGSHPEPDVARVQVVVTKLLIDADSFRDAMRPDSEH